MISPMQFSLSLVLIGIILTILAISKSRNNQFYSDTAWAWPLGIFVWGDALILGPFWSLTGLVSLWMQPIQILRFFLLFYTIRSAYEVVYWINHQVAQRDYQPPLFRNVSWLGANEAAILYQLLNTLVVVGSVFALSLII